MRTDRIARGLTVLLALVAWSSPVLGGDDTATYRGFRLGMTVDAVAAEAGISPAAATTVFERPLLIQEIEWRPAAAIGAKAAHEWDSVAQILFGFCNGELYRIVVSYDQYKTEGLTEQDLVEALSAAYGPSQTPVAKIITSPAAKRFADAEPVAARWEDASASVNLFHGAYRSAFGLVIFSKKLAPQARAGIEEGLRLSELDAPRRRIAEQKARDEIERAGHAKARSANKAAFRF